MSEVWVSRTELADAVGEIGAVILCASCGGRSFFIPRKPVGYLLDLLGPERMDQLCAEFGGMQVVIPNIRKGEPFKPHIIARLKQGEKPDRIAESLGVTTRYVRRLASGLRRNELSRQYSLLD